MDSVEDFSTCSTVVMSNQEPVPEFTPEKCWELVEAIYNASPESVENAASLAGSLLAYDPPTGLPRDLQNAARRLRRFFSQHCSNNFLTIAEILNIVRSERLPPVPSAIEEQRNDDDRSAATSSLSLTSASSHAAGALSVAHDNANDRGSPQVKIEGSPQQDQGGQPGNDGANANAQDAHSESLSLAQGVASLASFDGDGSALPDAIGGSQGGGHNPEVDPPPLNPINKSTAVLVPDTDSTIGDRSSTNH